MRKERQIIASWKSKEELSTILVHTSMLLDHGPSRTVDFIDSFYDQSDDGAPSKTIAMETKKDNQDSTASHPRQRPVSTPF